MPVDQNSASWRRSNWMLGQISDRANAANVGVWLLRYGQRGWNERFASPPSPIPDARLALDEVRRSLVLSHLLPGCRETNPWAR